LFGLGFKAAAIPEDGLPAEFVPGVAVLEGLFVIGLEPVARLEGWPPP
jgi:hypothetical protein